MTTKRKIVIIVGVAAWGCAAIAILNTKAIRQAHQDWEQHRKDAYFAQHVTGYFPQDWEPASSFVVRDVAYLDPHVAEYKWSKSGAQYRHYYLWLNAAAPEWSAPVKVSDAATVAISDALNIAVRDTLWNRSDQTSKFQVLDGGETAYEFVLGPHKGGFRLIQDPDVPDLRLFQHKIGIWTEDVRAQYQVAPSIATTAPSESAEDRVNSSWQ